MLGIGFVAIKFGLQQMPPFALCAWRYIAASIPLVFFVQRPNIGWAPLLGYGVAIGVVQFGLLFLALAIGMPAGLSSVVIQFQAFFTIGLSVWLVGERVQPAQLAGAAVAVIGLIVIGWAKVQGGLGTGFLLVIGAALAWSIGNLITKKIGRVDPLGFIAWSSLAAPLPLAVLSLLFESPDALVAPIMHPTWVIWGSILFTAYGATIFGFGTWSRLLARHDAAVVSPFALLIPVWGMGSTALVFGERMNAPQAMGAALVIAGLVLGVFGPAWYSALRNRGNRQS